MSLSNPRTVSPVKKFFKIRSSTGDVVYWDKAAQKEIEVDVPFKFIVLDILNTVGGFNEPSKSGIWSNEVKNTSTDVLTVRIKTGIIAEGTYSDIKDKLKASGGRFANSVYIAYQENNEWTLGNLNLIGASVSEWFDFTSGRSVDSDPGVTVVSFDQRKKGRNEYFVPQFERWSLTADELNEAVRLDKDLQEHLTRKTAEPAPSYNPPHSQPTLPQGNYNPDDFQDEVPF